VRQALLHEGLTAKTTGQAIVPGQGSQLLTPGGAPVEGMVSDFSFARGTSGGITRFFAGGFERLGIAAGAAFHPGQFSAGSKVTVTATSKVTSSFVMNSGGSHTVSPFNKSAWHNGQAPLRRTQRLQQDSEQNDDRDWNAE